MRKVAAFDLDGTLADTSRDLINAANATLGRHGVDGLLDPLTDQNVAFKGGRAMLKAGLHKEHGLQSISVDELSDWYREFLIDYESCISEHTVLYPHVEEAMQTLSEMGWGLGVCTNKPERLARILLADLGILNSFSSLIGADTLPVRKPRPEPLLHAISEAGGMPKQAVFVGDTDTDYHTARAAGVCSILVTFGPFGDDVRDMGADALLSDFSQLSGIATELISCIV